MGEVAAAGAGAGEVEPDEALAHAERPTPASKATAARRHRMNVRSVMFAVTLTFQDGGKLQRGTGYRGDNT